MCGGPESCADATIECPTGHECRVNCQGPRACENTTVQCGAGKCDVLCGEAEDTACVGLDFRCGSNDSTVTCMTTPSGEIEPVESDSDCMCEAIDCDT